MCDRPGFRFAFRFGFRSGFSVKLGVGMLLGTLVMAASLSRAESVPLAAYNYPMLMAEQSIPGRGNGYVVDIIRAAFAAAGREVDIHYFPTRRAMSMGVAPEFAGLIGAVEQFTADEMTERLPVVIGHIELKLFFRRDNARLPAQFQHLSDFQGLRLSAVLGSAALPMFEAAGLQYDTSPVVDNCISKLALQRIDLCAAVEVAAREAVERLYPAESEQIASYSRALLRYQLAVLFNRRYRDVHDIAPALQRGLSTIQRNGQYLAIAKRYYGKAVPENVFP